MALKNPPNRRSKTRLVERAGKMVFKELPTDDPNIRQPDITKARTILGWEPTVNRKEGLEKTIKYFRGKVRNH